MPHELSDPTQQEIWNTIRALNDAWTQGHADRLVDHFHPQMVAITPVDRLRREGADACIAGWKGFADAARIHHWKEIEPLIQVYGDAAVVTYYYDIDFEMNGQHLHQGGRDMFFLVRESGRWWAVADQFSSWPD